MEDDCFLPGFKRPISRLSLEARLTADWGDPGVLHNGVERKIWGNDNGYWGMCGRAITYTFKEKTKVSSFRLVVDRYLDREYIDGNPDALNISMVPSTGWTTTTPPSAFLSVFYAFRIEALDDDGNWRTVYETDSNRQRLVRGS